MNNHTFRNAAPSDAIRCFDVETSAYEGDEAATLEKIAKRIAIYPQGFLILEVNNEIVGFVNSGCAYDVEMSDEDFKELIGHDPAAPNAVIMSVVVDPEYQGQGLSYVLYNKCFEEMKEQRFKFVGGGSTTNKVLNSAKKLKRKNVCTLYKKDI